MAPEQSAGDWAAIGPASDVYALGAMLAELAEGTGDALDPGLARIAARAQQARAEQRHAHAGEVVSALEAWLDGAERREEALGLVLEARGHQESARAYCSPGLPGCARLASEHVGMRPVRSL